MRTCRRGHSYRGDENYRAKSGRCPICFKETQDRYDKSTKGKETTSRYNHSEKGQDRYARYKQSPKGWRQALIDRRANVMRRRAQRVTKQEAEDSSGTLPS